MVNLSYGCIGLLVAVFLACAVFRNFINPGTTAIEESKYLQTGSIGFLASTMMVVLGFVAWLILVAIPATAANGLKIASPPTNSFLQLDSDLTQQIVFLATACVAILTFLDLASIFIVATESFSLLRTNEANFESGFSALVPFHVGTVAKSVFLMMLFEIPTTIIGRIFPKIGNLYVFNILSCRALIMCAFTGSSLSDGAIDYEVVATAVPGIDKIMFGANFVVTLATITAAVVSTTIYLPHASFAAQNDATISSVVPPSLFVFVLALFASRCVLGLVTGAVGAHVVYCATNIQHNTSHGRCSEALIELLKKHSISKDSTHREAAESVRSQILSPTPKQEISDVFFTPHFPITSADGMHATGYQQVQ
jgi:hypothetical protein